MSTKYIDENITLDLGEIYFEGGCFWGVEGYFQKVKGVLETEVGYANGESDDTSYEEIDKTGHAETVMIKYNKNRITLEELLIDRKSTRLNSSHVSISYAVFCLKKKKY